MTELLGVRFGNGQIVFNGKIDAVPDSTEKSGNVTIHNKGTPERPAHYEATFMISADIAEQGLQTTNVFHWTVVVPMKDGNAPYREVEALAARQLAPILRAVADKVEAEVSRFDNEMATKSDKG